MKKMTRFILTLIMIFTVAISVSAADGNVIYSGNSGNFIFEPGSDYSPTDLFPNFKDVMPGDTLTQRIVVKNNAKKSVKISMRALGAHENSVDFLSKLNLYVEKVTDTPLFEATADQTAQLTEWREIGVLAASGEAELDVGLQVPTDLDNNYQELVGYLDWEFMVEEIDDGKVQTGDNANDLPWICGLGVSILAITVVVVKGGKDKKEKRDETE
ncbi:MAG: hypothetical protein IJE60_09635 [Tyzzerella sp.]|nr:hypothetical protein [Tyzzerella sp.]